MLAARGGGDQRRCVELVGIVDECRTVNRAIGRRGPGLLGILYGVDGTVVQWGRRAVMALCGRGGCAVEVENSVSQSGPTNILSVSHRPVKIDEQPSGSLTRVTGEAGHTTTAHKRDELTLKHAQLFCGNAAHVRSGLSRGAVKCSRAYVKPGKSRKIDRIVAG